MSRLVVLFGIISLFIATTVLADTHIPATTYTTNTTWSSPGNNYIIDGNVTVNSGVTLTVQAGVKVRFSGNYEIRIIGTIDVRGTNANRCSFASNIPNQQHGEIVVEGLGKFVYCDFDRMGRVDEYWGALAFSCSDIGSYVKNCEFGENVGNYYGGAIAIECFSGNAYADICSSSFKYNYAPFSGGAINAMGNVVTNIFDNMFGSNSCSIDSAGGGGALTVIHNTVTGSVYRNTFQYNGANEGGAIAGVFASMPISYNLLSHNSADQEGGGMYLLNSGEGSSAVNAFNNTIVDNSAYSGGGIYEQTEDASTVIKNNIIWGNTATDGEQVWSAGSSQFIWSDIEGGFTGTGNIDVDPELLANYHIECGSPAIDAGDPADMLEGDYTYVDQGAFHFHQIRGSGDANNDCSITSADPAFLVNYLKGLGSAPYPFWKGDANGDCNVNGLDVLYLTSWLSYHVNAPKKNNCADVRWNVADPCDPCGYY